VTQPKALTFTVTGDPVPQGSHRIVGRLPKVAGARPRRGRIVDSNKALVPWRRLVAFQAHRAAVRDLPTPFEGPLVLTVAFTLRKGPSVRRTWPAVKPDLDKLVRAIGDALSDAGNVWGDDGQVVTIVASKWYVGQGQHALDIPGVTVTVGPLETSFTP
jgi:Holliday junction resolvase RusA-like endonuclease